MLDFMTFLTTVLYLHDPIPGNLRQTLLHPTLYTQKSVFTAIFIKDGSSRGFSSDMEISDLAKFQHNWVMSRTASCRMVATTMGGMIFCHR